VANRSRSRRLGVGAGLAFLATAMLGLAPSVATAQSPQLFIDPPLAPAGWAIAVSGTGWDSSLGPVSVYSSIDDATKTTATSLAPPAPSPSPTPDAKESFSTTLVVPFLPPGAYTFVACQDCGDTDSHPLARMSFTIEVPAPPTLSLSPASGAPGSTTTAVGTGWNPLNGPVGIFPDADTSTPDTALVTGVDPQPDGGFTASVHAPSSARRYDFVACQRCGSEPAASQSATFTVVSSQAPPALVVVPNLVGLDTRRARQLTHALHLGLAVTRQGAGDEPGVVASQSPRPGTRVPRGTRVHVVARTTLVITTEGRRRPSAAVIAAAALIVLAGAIGAIAVARLRPRRWARRHVRTKPHPDLVPNVTGHRVGDAPDHAVRVVPHGDRGVQTLEEVGS
jgi:PASTA domain